MTNPNQYGDEEPNERSSSVSSSALSAAAAPASRRQVLQQSASTTVAAMAAGVSLASSLSFPEPASAEGNSKKTIVITGANSGIGFQACQRLATASEQDYTIVLACRTLAKAQGAVDRILSSSAASPSSSTLIPAECDLSSQASIQAFSQQLPQLLETPKIDALCLNAGLARNTGATDVERTQDGFELTVGVNHFGHFYLNSLLLPMMNNDNGSRIVVTASGLHDPASPGGAQGVPAGLGDLKGLQEQGKACELLDGSPYNPDKAYKDSKLCNVLFTRELQRRLQQNTKTSNIVATCFNPGLIVGTGFFRYQNQAFTKVFDFAATDLFRVGETPAWGGGCLSYMVTKTVDAARDGGAFYSSPPGSSKFGDAAYGNQFNGPFPISVEAQDNAKAKLLWELSERELGIV
mmetsp:Transcript_9672/g.20856  ORF Transcript_9672/g.20856 Transcript_9672/m.20856 type:complete len:407 (-) Transcript_9672:150-1370(-)